MDEVRARLEAEQKQYGTQYVTVRVHGESWLPGSSLSDNAAALQYSHEGGHRFSPEGSCHPKGMLLLCVHSSYCASLI